MQTLKLQRDFLEVSQQMASKRGTHVEGVSVDDEGLVLLVGEELRRVADVDGRLLLVARQHL